MALSRRRALGILAAAGLAATSSPRTTAEFRKTVSESLPDTVLFQDGDDLTESNLARLLARSNSSDYVERGLRFSADYRDNTLTIGSGMAVVADSSTNRAYVVLTDQRQNISLPITSGTNYVHLTIDPSTQDAVSIHIDGDDSPPSTPSLKIGEADTANDTSTELNRRPDLIVGDITSDGTTVYDADTNTVGDGTTRANHESVRADDLLTKISNRRVVVTTDKWGGSDIFEAFNNARSSEGGGVLYDIPPGDYTVSTTMNYTDLDLTPLDLRGADITLQTDGSPGIDMTSTRYPFILGGVLRGDATLTPNVGVLQARDSSNNHANQLKAMGTQIFGEYTVAGWYNYGGEVSRFFGCNFDTASGYPVYVVMQNDASVTSPNTTIQSGSVSTNEVQFFSCRAVYAGGGSTVSAIRSQADNLKIDGGFIASNGLAGIHIDTQHEVVGYPEITQVRTHPARGSNPNHGLHVSGRNDVIEPSIRQNLWQATAETVMWNNGNPIIGGEYRLNRSKGGDAPRFRARWDGGDIRLGFLGSVTGNANFRWIRDGTVIRATDRSSVTIDKWDTGAELRTGASVSEGPNRTQRFQGARSSQPTPDESSAVYLDDGTGTNTAGWYLTTDGGSNWTGPL